MSDLPSEPPAEKRKMTDWPVRYFHGHRINVQRWEDNRVARVTKVNDDGSREVLLIEPMGVTQRLGFRLDDQLHALADLEALPLDSWTPHAAPSVSSSAPPPTWDEMASMFPDNSKRANRPRGSSAEPAPPTCQNCGVNAATNLGILCSSCTESFSDNTPRADRYRPKALSPVQEEATPTPKNQRIEVSITITGGDGVQRHELAGTIQMQARNAAKKRGLTVDCCTTNDEGL